MFIPDIDRWEKWERSIRDVANTVDLAFLDGTFASPTEVNRNIEEIPHPMMRRTRELLHGARAQALVHPHQPHQRRNRGGGRRPRRHDVRNVNCAGYWRLSRIVTSSTEPASSESEETGVLPTNT